MTTSVDKKQAPPPPPPHHDPAQPDAAAKAPKPATPAPPDAPAATPPPHVVQRGETLGGIAQSNGTHVDTIRKINPQIRNPDHILVGDKLNMPRATDVPPQPAPTPPAANVPTTPEAARVDNAVKSSTASDHQLGFAKQEAARGNTVLAAAVPALERGAAAAKTELKTAVAGEIAKTTGATATDATVAKAGQDIAARYAGTAPAKAAVDDATASVRTDREVQRVVNAAQATPGDPAKSFQALSNGVAQTPSAIKDRVLADPRVQGVVDAAATWANAPLTTKPDGAVLPQGQTAEAIQRLDKLTQGGDKSLAATLTDKAAPAYNDFIKANADEIGSTSAFGTNGMTSLMNISSRITGTPAGDHAIAQFAAGHAWNTDSVRNAIGAGADPAYAVEFGRQMKAGGIDPSIVVGTINEGIAQRDQSRIGNGDSPAATMDVARRMQNAGLDSNGVVKVATDGVAAFKDKVTGDVAALAKHDAALSFLVQKDGAGMSPQKLNDAVNDFRNRQTPEWKDDETKLRQTIADDGGKLTAQLIAMNNAAPGVPASRAGIDQTIKTIANDPAAGLAISTAIQNDPNLGDAQHVNDMANVFTLSKVGDVGKKFTNEAASKFLRTNVSEKLQGLNLADPASVASAKSAIEGLKDAKFARLLGISPSDLGKAVDQVQKSADAVAANPAQSTAALAQLNKTLDQDALLSKTFNKTTVAGQMLRGVGVLFAGASLLNSGGKAIANPSDPQNDIKAALDAVGFAQKNTELLVGLGAVNKQSTLGQFGGEWKLAGRASAGDLIAGVSAVLDGVSAVRSGFGIGTQQDTGNAVFSATTAVGGALTVAPVFGAAAWLGPVGLGVTAIGVLGKAGYDAIKDAHQYEGAGRDFLKAGGYSDAAADALSKQGGVISGAAGSSQLPFLQKYAELKGIDPAKMQDYVNKLTPDQVNALSQRLLQTAGDSGGDPGKFVDGPPQTATLATGSPVPATVTLANTLGVFESYLNRDHVPLP